MSVIGSVYLLHFDPGLENGNRIVRHYVGWTEGPVEARVQCHVEGRGSPLVRAAVERGATVQIERVWTDVDRHFARRLKCRRETPRFCPTCVREGRTGDRGLLDKDHLADDDTAWPVVVSAKRSA
jgi:hypothetical protein